MTGLGENRVSKTIETFKRIVGRPFSFLRTEKLRNEQADALLARSDLTKRDLPAIAALAKGPTYNTTRSRSMTEFYAKLAVTSMSNPYSS